MKEKFLQKLYIRLLFPTIFGFFPFFQGCNSEFQASTEKNLRNAPETFSSFNSSLNLNQFTSTAELQPLADRLIGELLPTYDHLKTADFPTSVSFPLNLDDATLIADSGRSVFLGLEIWQRDSYNNKVLKPNASQILNNLLARYPLFKVPGVRIFVLDEMFWTGTGTGDLDLQFSEVMKAVRLVRSTLPNAKLGINFTPATIFALQNNKVLNDKALDYIKKALALLDWMGFDPYTFDMSSFGPYSLDNLVSIAENAADFSRQANPRIERWLVLQGFANPSWNLVEFSKFIQKQMDIANEKYEGTIVFGWQLQGIDLPDSWAGMHFPPWLKTIYFNFAIQNPKYSRSEICQAGQLHREICSVRRICDNHKNKVLQQGQEYVLSRITISGKNGTSVNVSDLDLIADSSAIKMTSGWGNYTWTCKKGYWMVQDTNPYDNFCEFDMMIPSDLDSRCAIFNSSE